MFLHHIVAQGVARRVCMKERSSACHHISDRTLSLFAFTSSSLSLSKASTSSLISSSPPSFSSSSMWSKPPNVRSPPHPQNEEYCTLAIHNPLTEIGSRFRPLSTKMCGSCTQTQPSTILTPIQMMKGQTTSGWPGQNGRVSVFVLNMGPWTVR